MQLQRVGRCVQAVARLQSICSGTGKSQQTSSSTATAKLWNDGGSPSEAAIATVPEERSYEVRPEASDAEQQEDEEGTQKPAADAGGWDTMHDLLMHLHTQKRRKTSAMAGSLDRRQSSVAVRRRPVSAHVLGRGSDRRRMSSSAASTRTGGLTGTSAVPMGANAWQPCIAGGLHASYTCKGAPQPTPQLGTRTDRGGASLRSPWTWEEVGRADMEALLDHVPFVGEGKRKVALCPRVRRSGVCRLPACPFIHDPFRPVKEHKPLYNAGACTDMKNVKCRFLLVLGICPYGDGCPYDHSARKVTSTSPRDSEDVPPAPSQSRRKGSRDATSGKARRPASAVGRNVAATTPAAPTAPKSDVRLLRRGSSSSFEGEIVRAVSAAPLLERVPSPARPAGDVTSAASVSQTVA